MSVESCPMNGVRFIDELAQNHGIPSEALPRPCQGCLLVGAQKAREAGKINAETYRDMEEPLVPPRAMTLGTVAFFGATERREIIALFWDGIGPENVVSRMYFDYSCQLAEDN